MRSPSLKITRSSTYHSRAERTSVVTAEKNHVEDHRQDTEEKGNRAHEQEPINQTIQQTALCGTTGFFVLARHLSVVLGDHPSVYQSKDVGYGAHS